MVYVPAPVGTITTELPEQMVALLTARVGVVFTETVETALEEIQLLVLVPVTEYEVFAVGDTVKLPPLIVYVTAPVGVITTELPKQIVALFTAKVGVAFTDTVDTTVFEAAQLLAPVPVTE